MILSLVLLALISPQADRACVGFTGAECDRSYPFTMCGLKAAVREFVRNDRILSTDVRVGAGVIRLEPFHFCDDEEWGEFLRHPGNFANGTPWQNRRLDLTRPNFAAPSLEEMMDGWPVMRLPSHMTLRNMIVRSAVMGDMEDK